MYIVVQGVIYFVYIIALLRIVGNFVYIAPTLRVYLFHFSPCLYQRASLNSLILISLNLPTNFTLVSVPTMADTVINRAKSYIEPSVLILVALYGS